MWWFEFSLASVYDLITKCYKCDSQHCLTTVHILNQYIIGKMCMHTVDPLACMRFKIRLIIFSYLCQNKPKGKLSLKWKINRTKTDLYL